MAIRIIFSVISLLPIPVNAQMHQQLLNAHFQKLENAKRYALRILDSMNEEKLDYRPVKEEMSFREQIFHIGQNLYWLGSTYLREESTLPIDIKKRPGDASRNELSIFLNDAYDYALASIKILDESTLSREFKWRDGTLNKLQFLNLIQDHQSHHIGQLIVYLRLNNVLPPPYVGW